MGPSESKAFNFSWLIFSRKNPSRSRLKKDPFIHYVKILHPFPYCFLEKENVPGVFCKELFFPPHRKVFGQQCPFQSPPIFSLAGSPVAHLTLLISGNFYPLELSKIASAYWPRPPGCMLWHTVFWLFFFYLSFLLGCWLYVLEFSSSSSSQPSQVLEIFIGLSFIGGNVEWILVVLTLQKLTGRKKLAVRKIRYLTAISLWRNSKLKLTNSL